MPKCTTMECHNEAIAHTTGGLHCIICTLKILQKFGSAGISSLPGAKLPWEYPDDMTCKACGAKFNKYYMALGESCPKCHKGIHAKNYNERGKIIIENEPHITYKEGSGHD